MYIYSVRKYPTPGNLIAHELVGLEVEVIKSTNASDIGIKGKVLDETKNLLIIKNKNRKVKLIKKNCVFNFYLPYGKVSIDGSQLEGDPVLRTKKNINKVK